MTEDRKITIPRLVGMKRDGRKIAVLTAYSWPIARILDEAGIPVILVGDSVGMVEAGYSTTLPVTMEEMLYHTGCVVRAVKRALVVADMPFMSYQQGTAQAIGSAGRFLKEAGAEAVKLEGGKNVAHIIRALTDVGIPVMGHVGLTPQSVHSMGGYRVQGRTTEEAERIIEDALAVEEAGAFSVVLEGIPAELAREITSRLEIPTIGIGAGPHCDGQVLVVNDLLGLTEKVPGFVKKYANLRELISKAVTEYREDVEEGRFPKDEGC